MCTCRQHHRSIDVVRARCYRATSTTHTSILHITFTYTRFAFSRVRASPHVRCGCITMCPYTRLLLRCSAAAATRAHSLSPLLYGFTVRPNSSIYEVVKRCPFGVLVQCLADASRTSTSAHIKPNDPDTHSMSPSRPMQLVVQPGAGARSFL